MEFLVYRLDGDGKPDPFRVPHDHGVYSVDIPLLVNERAATVARIDRRIDLQEKGAVRFLFPVAGKDPGGQRIPQSTGLPMV